MNRPSSRAIGIIQSLLSGFCFGFLGWFGKGAFGKGLTPGEVLSLRFSFAGVLLLAGLAVFAPQRLKLNRAQVLWSIVLGAAGYAAFSFFYFQALSGLSVSLTVLLLYMYPVIVAAGAWAWFGERIPRERWFVLPLAMTGLILLVWGEFYVRSPIALAFGLASAAWYSVYILCSRRYLRDADPFASCGIMQLSAGLALALLTWRDPTHIAGIVRAAWPSLLGLALICSVAAMSLFLAGLQRLKSWEVSILSTLEPITSIAVAYLLLDERLTDSQLAGAALALTAFICVSLPARRKERAHVV